MVAWPTTGGSEGTWNDEMETFVHVGHNADGTHDEAGLTAQVVNSQSGVVATGTNLIPLDDSIPQNTEGTELTVLNTTITPNSATNNLIIEVVINVTQSNTEKGIVIALFQDSTANALCVATGTAAAPSFPETITLRHFMTTGTTSTTTFKIRFGSDLAGTVTVNGSAGARRYGGILISSMTITEVWV